MYALCVYDVRTIFTYGPQITNALKYSIRHFDWRHVMAHGLHRNVSSGNGLALQRNISHKHHTPHLKTKLKYIWLNFDWWWKTVAKRLRSLQFEIFNWWKKCFFKSLVLLPLLLMVPLRIDLFLSYFLLKFQSFTLIIWKFKNQKNWDLVLAIHTNVVHSTLFGRFYNKISLLKGRMFMVFFKSLNQ